MEVSINMSSTLDKLTKLANAGNINQDPYENEKHDIKPSDNSSKKFEKMLSKKARKEESFLSRLNRKLEDYGYLSGDDFDDILDSIDIDDEDIELKNNLISMGRRYARSNAVTEEEGEVDKAFAPQEQKLKDLYTEVSKDVIKIEKDLEELRGTSFGKNAMKTAELASAKNSLHATKLSIIKELNSMKKSQFEIKSKIDKNNVSNGMESFASADMMQRIFGMGHDSIISSVGGRESAAGDPIYEYGSDSAAYSAEDEIGERMCDEYADTYQDSEGDIYLKYEGKNINVVVEEHCDGTKEIYAEDENGERVSDYPVPKDVDELSFDINERTGTAIDQLQRKYIYRTTK